MATGTGVLLGLLLAFLLGSSGTSAEARNSEGSPAGKCVLSGSWKSYRGSTMNISDSGDSGVFSGSYMTAVAATDATIQLSPLQGVQHSVARSAQPIFGFTVNWNFSESTTVFVGQCFLDAHRVEHLNTTWLLREKVESMAEDWAATRVGTDTFYRIK